MTREDSPMNGDGLPERCSHLQACLVQIALPIVVVIVALLQFLPYIGAEPFHGDESIWIRSSATYFGLVLEGDLDAEEWWNWEGRDQPPVGRYLIGAGIFLTGHGDRLGELAALPDYDFEQGPQWNRDHGTVPPRDILLSLRRVMVVFGVLCCLTLYATGYLAFGPGTGLLAGVLLAFSPAAQACCRRSMTDAPLMLFMLLALLFTVGLARESLRGRPWRATIMSILAGLAVGLATATKYNGALSGIVLVVAGLWLATAPRRRPAVTEPDGKTDGPLPLAPRSIVGLTSLAVFLSLALFFAVNPTLHRRSLHQVQTILKQRQDTVRQLADAPGALHSVGERIVAVAGSALLPGPNSCTPLGRLIPFPVELFLMPAGLIVLGLREIRSLRGTGPPSAGSAVLAWVLVTYPVVTLWLPHDWVRYYLPQVACVAMMSAVALAAFTAHLASRFAGSGR